MTAVRGNELSRELTVLLGGHIAGNLHRSRARTSYTFSYEDDWRNDPRAYPLSLSIPLAGKTHDGSKVGYYLRALLPDNEARLNAIASQYRVDPDDWFGLLAYVGEDCPGAVQFARPERVAALTGTGKGRIDWLGEGELAGLLRGLASGLDGEPPWLDVGQFSLPGALAKIALVRDAQNKRWGRPYGRAATTHILKPPLRGVPFHNENEHLCLELARAVGFAAAGSRLIRVDDQTAIAVERYDRLRRGGAVTRLHQEDCSQALGANPRLKYASEGAPGISEIVALLRDHSSRGLADVYEFLKAVAFNWVIAGTDAHPRNYSLLIRAGAEVQLAPLYDLASALFLKTRINVPDLPFPMRVAGRSRLGSIGADAWTDLAKGLQLKAARLLEEVAGVAQRIGEVAESVAAVGEASGLDPRFCERFAVRVRSRALDCLSLVKG